MIWLTWRQFRAQTLVAAGALALLAIYLIYLGSEIRSFYDTRIANCAEQACYLARLDLRATYDDAISIMVVLLIAVPGLIGVFWGAPLVTQELEQRTDRLVWNQSVTRTKWLAVKLTVIGLASMAVAGLFSLLLTWSASRYDQVIGERFAALSFGSRNIVPIGYALFAFVLGTVVGMIVKRTLPAMAITLIIFAGLQLLIPTAIRQNLMPPITDTVAVDTNVLNSGVGMNLKEDNTFDIQGYTANGSWALQFSSPLYKADGTPYRGEDAKPCLIPDDREASDACTAAQNLHFDYTYQPGYRYWTFQWIELSMFFGLSLLLTAFGFFWLRRRS
ncbi:ABC transporter permease subunit [Salinispora vitiensis]|uniref:ABC transporter permease subunit n=1 Tax=Salinispora vitiensis TaxID=999544 RepID=UPI0003686474|nr:ABC transporter permease subunit [Salinispora vitiensis]